MTKTITNTAKKYLAAIADSSRYAMQIESQKELHNERTLQAIKDCLVRSKRNQLALTAILNEDLETRLPEMDAAVLENFGQRAAYRTQLRSPWANNGRCSITTRRGELQGGNPATNHASYSQ